MPQGRSRAERAETSAGGHIPDAGAAYGLKLCAPRRVAGFVSCGPHNITRKDVLDLEALRLILRGAFPATLGSKSPGNRYTPGYEITGP